MTEIWGNALMNASISRDVNKGAQAIEDENVNHAGEREQSSGG